MWKRKRIYVSSDYHFNHDREFIWKARGFQSVEEKGISDSKEREAASWMLRIRAVLHRARNNNVK